MLEGKTVAVVVPALQRGDADRDDARRASPSSSTASSSSTTRSKDGTTEAVRAAADRRVELVEHERNQGVGAAIVTGYQRALEDEIDVTCVMAADDQMDPADLADRRAGRAR